MTNKEKNIVFLVLKTGIKLVSEIKEILPQEIGEPDCKLISPLEVEYIKESKSYDLTPWLFAYVDQQDFVIHSDSILTMSPEVNEELKIKYLEYIEDL